MHFKLFASASTLALTAMTTSIDAFPEQTLTETYLSEALAQTNAVADLVSHSHSHSHAHCSSNSREDAAKPHVYVPTPEEKHAAAKAAHEQKSANAEAKHEYELDRFHGPGPVEGMLDWVANIWKIGKPVYEAYRPKLCEECTMDPWIVMRRLKQIMDCKINCQPPYLFKPSKTGPPRPEQAIGQTFPNNKPIPYDPDNIAIKKQMKQDEQASKEAAIGSLAADAGMAESIKAAQEKFQEQEKRKAAALAAKAAVQNSVTNPAGMFTGMGSAMGKMASPLMSSKSVPATPSVKAQTGVVYPVGTGYNQPTADLGSYY